MCDRVEHECVNGVGHECVNGLNNESFCCTFILLYSHVLCIK